MQSARIKFIIALISFGVLGLASVQTYWISYQIDLEKQRFHHHVFEALNNSVKRIEKICLLGPQETSSTGNAQSAVQDMIARQNQLLNQFLGSDSGMIDESVRHHQDLLKDLLADMYRGKSSPIVSSIDSAQLRKIVSDELHNHGIEIPFFYLVVNSGEDVPTLISHPKWKDRIMRSPYVATLFSGNIFSQPESLYIYFPGRNVYFLKEIWVSLTFSVVFILLIVLSFYASIKTILSQKKLSEIRTDFINNITHELKTPVATISLATEAMSIPEIASSEEKRFRYNQMIKEEIKRLQGLIEMVLTTAITAKEGFKLKLENIDLAMVLQDIVSRARLHVEKSGGTIGLQLPDRGVYFTGDALHIGNALYNVLDNAVKYTERTPQIAVSMSVGKEICIQISDNGIGIPPEHQKRVFDSMFRVPTGNLHNVKGFGLGLSYCKNVIERHGGRVELKSEMGKGSTFSIFLPVQDNK